VTPDPPTRSSATPNRAAERDAGASECASVAIPGGGGAEFEVIGRLRERFEAEAPRRRLDGEVWIGDDAALVDVVPGRLPVPPLVDAGVLLATDLVVQDVHVDLALCLPEDVGWKAVMVTVSDIAAMGGSPSSRLGSLALAAGVALAPAAGAATPGRGAAPARSTATQTTTVSPPIQAGTSSRSRMVPTLVLRQGRAGPMAMSTSNATPMGRVMVSKNGAPTVTFWLVNAS
jgi:hypothetical protein